MGDVIKFPQVANNNKAEAKGITMNICRTRNGKTVYTNLLDLTQEELLQVLLGDAIMKEKQDLAKKYIGQ